MMRAIGRAAVAAVALILAGCAHPDQQSTPSPSTTIGRPAAPVTFTHATPAPTIAPTIAPTRHGSPTTTSGIGSSPPPPVLSTLGSSTTGDWTETSAPNLGGPANAHEITAPIYNLDRIDRRSAEQVAWAYLVSLMSYNYTDAGPGVGAAQAATYAVPPKKMVTQTTGSVSPSAAWANVVTNQMVSRAAVTELTAYIPTRSTTGAQASIYLSWVSTLTQRGGSSQRISGQTTVLEIRQSDGNWLVSDNGFGSPN